MCCQLHACGTTGEGLALTHGFPPRQKKGAPGKEIGVNPASQLGGWHGYTSVLCTVSSQQYHARAEGVALGHWCRKSQSNPVYRLCLLKGRADTAPGFYFPDLTPGFMGRIQAHVAGHHLNTYLSCRKGPGRGAACRAPHSASSLSQLHAAACLQQEELAPRIHIPRDRLVRGLCQRHTSINSAVCYPREHRV